MPDGPFARLLKALSFIQNNFKNADGRAAPAFDAAWPWLLDLFGGRQSARSIHFICTAGFVGFILVHLALVVLAGPVNEIRSMITGWFHVREIKGEGSRGERA